MDQTAPFPAADASVFEAVARVKQGAAQFNTSFFSTPEQIREWMAGGVLSTVETPGCLLLFRRDRDFHRLYHVASDLESLARALASLPASVHTVDLIGRPEQLPPVAAVYEKHGFRTQTTLVRMSHLSASAGTGYLPDPDVAFAGEADVPAIGAFFGRLLNRFVDQIPTPEQLSEYARQGTLLLVRRGAGPAAVLLFENLGLTAHLRYWYVDRQFRDEGLGRKLIRTFLYLTRDTKRRLLWVIHDNADAIAKYRHYGFAEEKLLDQILLNSGRNE